MKLKVIASIALVLSGFGALSATVLAHHGGSEYDHKNLISIKGINCYRLLLGQSALSNFPGCEGR